MGHYEVLGVAPGAAAAEVRRAYLSLARAHHPDRAGGDDDRMRAVNAAWAVLGDPVRRRQYDLERGIAPATGPWPGSSAADPAEVDDLADLGDDVPVRITIALPRLLTLLPAGMFGASIAIAGAAVLLNLRPLLGLALIALVLSVMFFVASPFFALYASRRPSGGGPRDGSR